MSFGVYTHKRERGQSRCCPRTEILQASVHNIIYCIMYIYIYIGALLCERSSVVRLYAHAYYKRVYSRYCSYRADIVARPIRDTNHFAFDLYIKKKNRGTSCYLLGRRHRRRPIYRLTLQTLSTSARVRLFTLRPTRPYTEVIAFPYTHSRERAEGRLSSYTFYF